MHTLMKFIVFGLLLNIIQVHGKNQDYLAKFFETKDPADLHENAKQFLLLIKSFSRDTNGYKYSFLLCFSIYFHIYIY